MSRRSKLLELVRLDVRGRGGFWELHDPHNEDLTPSMGIAAGLIECLDMGSPQCLGSAQRMLVRFYEVERDADLKVLGPDSGTIQVIWQILDLPGGFLTELIMYSYWLNITGLELSSDVDYYFQLWRED